MSNQTKMIAIVGGVLLVVALALKFLVVDKPPAPPAQERGFHP